MNPKAMVIGAGVIGGLLLLGGGIYAWRNYPIWFSKAPAGPAGFAPPEAVQVIEARTAKWQPTASMVGTVFALQSITVSNEVAGTVKSINFDSGSIVEKGDVLLTLDTSTEEADLKAAEATINMATASRTMIETNVALAESRARRIGEAMQSRAASAMDADQAKADLDAAKANLVRVAAEAEQAKARADQVRALIEKKRIRAPFKSRVGIRSIHPGQYLKEGSEITSLQGIDKQIYLDFALPQEEARRVKPDAVFMITSKMLGPAPVPLKVVAMDSQVSMTTRNVRVRGIVDNSNDTLRAGMSIEVVVPVEDPHDYVVIPAMAVRHATYGDHVFLIGPSTKEGEGADKLRARQQFVKLGPVIGPDVIVLDGLKAGDRIASVGSFKLRDGALVMPGGDQPPGKPAAAPTPEPAQSKQ